MTINNPPIYMGLYGNETKRGNGPSGLKVREEKVSSFYFSFIYTFSKYLFKRVLNQN
jgi:hypothetical protein